MSCPDLTTVKEAVQDSFKETCHEVREECCMPADELKSNVYHVLSEMKSFLHIPYFPSLHSTGWLVRYIIGPHTPTLIEDLFYDVSAGVTVGLTLVPQALSYAQLANLPPVVGMYAAILPSIGYAMVGSSLQLQVGPVALVSLLTAELIVKYGIDYVNDIEAAMDTAAQAALCCGIILTVMSVLNLGRLINFISMPVMSGFTTAAACLIGLSQLKNAFGFSQKTPSVPQQGQEGYEYNYQVMTWYKDYFYQRFTTHSSDTAFLKNGDQYHHLWINPYSVKIAFGLYVPMMLINILKQNIKATPERKKTRWFKAFNTLTALMPFAAIIIGAHIAWQLKHDDGYHRTLDSHSWYKSNLKTVGAIKPGLHFIRIPKLRFPMGKFLADVIPLTLIAYMESYSVARRIAAQRNELHILSASQEMWANGVANLIACVCSAYPVSGSFSRSSLNYASGARTPIAKLVTVCVIVLALGALTKVLYYIPNAALAAIIFVAVSNLINFTEYWEAWRHSKKDFFTMVVTTTIVFLFDTSTGLAVGIGCSIIVLLGDTVLGRRNVPWVVKSRQDNDGVDLVKLESDINFLNAHRIKDFICGLFIQPPAKPDVSNSTVNERYFYAITSTFDKILRPDVYDGVEDIPKAIVIDFSVCRMIDLTGLKVVSEILSESRAKGVKNVIINIHPELVHQLKKFGIKNDSSTEDCYLDPYLYLSSLEQRRPAAESPPLSSRELVASAVSAKGTEIGTEIAVGDVEVASKEAVATNERAHADGAHVIEIEMTGLDTSSVGENQTEGYSSPTDGSRYEHLPTSDAIPEKDR
jgi:SulP family sulfate permease